MMNFSSLFSRRPKQKPKEKSARLDRDPAFAKYPRIIALQQQDPWRVDFWRGTLPKTEAEGIRHMLAASHLRKVEGTAAAADRRSPKTPHRNDETATHEFFLLFAQPPSQERKLVWRAQLDLGHALYAEAAEAYRVAQARHKALGEQEDSRFGEGLQAANRALQELARSRSNLRAVEVQLDVCARSVCEAIALALESASLCQLLRQERATDIHWGDVAGFAALQCRHLKDRRKRSDDGMVRGVILD